MCRTLKCDISNQIYPLLIYKERKGFALLSKNTVFIRDCYHYKRSLSLIQNDVVTIE